MDKSGFFFEKQGNFQVILKFSNGSVELNMDISTSLNPPKAQPN